MAAIACSSAATSAFVPSRSAPSPTRSIFSSVPSPTAMSTSSASSTATVTMSSSKQKSSFWPRRKSSTGTTITISSPVLISRSDKGRRCVPVSEAAQLQMAVPSVTTTTRIIPASTAFPGQLYSPLRLNPITPSIRKSYASVESEPVPPPPSDMVSPGSPIATSAPAEVTTFADAAALTRFSFTAPSSSVCEVSGFVFPAPPSPELSPAPPRSVVSSVPSSRFSVWSDIDDSSDVETECDEDDDDDDLSSSCPIDVLAEPRFEDVTPVASPISTSALVDIEAEIRSLAVAARTINEGGKRACGTSPTTASEAASSLARRARMAIYIPSTSTSELEFFADDDDASLSAGLVFYPPVPPSRSTGYRAPVPVSHSDESDLDDLLSAYF